MGPSISIAVSKDVPAVPESYRVPLSALPVQWGDADSFHFGDPDPSPFVVGFEDSEPGDGDETLMRERIPMPARYGLVVGALCNGDDDHTRLAEVASYLAVATGGVVVASFHHRMPGGVAQGRWARLASPEPHGLGDVYRYLLEPDVLRAWARHPGLRFVK